jgi:hypothetical protein
MSPVRPLPAFGVRKCEYKQINKHKNETENFSKTQHKKVAKKHFFKFKK